MFKITHSKMKIAGLPELRAGDKFVVAGTGTLSRLFRFFQWVWDFKGKWSHAGIIIDNKGNTIEALWTVHQSSINSYAGLHVRIFRWNGTTLDTFTKGMSAISCEMGERYPWWKLPLFIIPPFAHLARTGKFVVCSELGFKETIGEGFNKLDDGDGDDDWKGKEPDQFGCLPEQFPSDFSIVFDGTMPKI